MKKFAHEIETCEDCPINPCGAYPPFDPPCTYWDENEEIDEDWLYHKQVQNEYYYEQLKKMERTVKIKRAPKTQKQYAHLDEKAKIFKDWFNKKYKNFHTKCRRKNYIYICEIEKKKSNYCFDLEKDKFFKIQGKTNAFEHDLIVNHIENPWREFYYKEKTTHQNTLKDIINDVNNFFNP